jgi:hypothetical protein
MRERRDGGYQRRYNKQCYSHRRNSFSVAWSWSGSCDWGKQCDAGETGAGQDAH